jgi:hypothetical protein
VRPHGVGRQVQLVADFPVGPPTSSTTAPSGSSAPPRRACGRSEEWAGFKLFAAAHKQCEAQLRRALGDDAYAAAIQRGTDLGWCLGLAGCGERNQERL